MRNRRPGIVVIGGLLMVSWLALPAQAAPRYNIVALDTLPIPSGEDPFGFQSFATPSTAKEWFDSITEIPEPSSLFSSLVAIAILATRTRFRRVVHCTPQFA